jgi:SAM-dependent methyltransferase
MMFGLREEFRYLECLNCGCLQLLDVPKDFSKYYPSGYYSFQKQGFIKTFLRHQWSAYAYGGWNPIGWAVTKAFASNDAMISLRRLALQKSARILDVGCGAGNLLQDLRHLGFANVSGADPYIESDLVYNNGLTIYRKSIAEMPGQFDVVMLHHSFEHMDEPWEAMRHLARLLAPAGCGIIRIPVASSYGWKHYGVNWVHLDAPRHLFLHTGTSIGMLADRAGLRVESVVYDGNEGGLWASEQYAKDIPLLDARSYNCSKSKSIFTRKQIREYKLKATELNRSRQGDLACFYLRPAKRG